MKLFFMCSAASGLAMLLSLSSCEHKDLCYDHGHYVEVDVRFNWAEAPDANPSTMVVNFSRPTESISQPANSLRAKEAR